MECNICNKKAAYICKFCGQIICKECKKAKPYILSAYDEEGDVPKVLAVEDAAWCGKCHPLSKSIEVPELE